MFTLLRTEKVYIVVAVILIVLATSLYFISQKTVSNLTPAYDADEEVYKWEIATLISGLEVPWDLSLDEAGRMFITERPGRLKVLEKNGNVRLIATLPQVVSVGESGLTGLTLHPDFSENNYIYLYYSFARSSEILNRVSRFSLKDESLQDEKIILDNLPGGSIHNGGRLRFGPDKKLWVLTGDAGHSSLAQDKTSLGGKVLRLNDDGSGLTIYSLGHRNPQGLAWHSKTGQLLITEHGQSAHDEINLILQNKNYGWPEVKICFSDNPKYTNPILCSEKETWAPSGLDSFGNSFFFAGLRGNLLERFEIKDGKVTNRETIIKGTYGRLRAVLIDKEGNIYVSTSNRDGRGKPSLDDDKILKITPKKVSP